MCVWQLALVLNILFAFFCTVVTQRAVENASPFTSATMRHARAQMFGCASGLMEEQNI